MRERHLALVIEDDKEIVEDLLEILSSLDCDAEVVDNREDAMVAVQNKAFCFILLDLQIKKSRDSIKAHVEHGKALLRNIRGKYHEHNGTAFCLPVLIVSGFARERDEAIDVMKDGASHVIYKPLDRQLSERIRQALEDSGRLTHAECQQPGQTQRPNPKAKIAIAIPGDRIGRRTRVTVGGKQLEITDSTLMMLLHLMLAKCKGEPVNKSEMGATKEQGFKGMSILRNELKPLLSGVNIIKSHYHGDYSFVDNVTIGECATDKLLAIGDHRISKVASELHNQLQTINKQSEGNPGNFPRKSASFPTHQHRRSK